MNLALVCVGGGSSSRFGGDKLAARIGGRMVLELTLNALHAAYPDVPIVVVTPADAIERWRRHVVSLLPHAAFVPGGELRQDSVRAGVERAAALGADVVAVHDAARPLVHPDDVRRVVETLGSTDGAILCRRVEDTVKRVDDRDSVLATVPRDDLRLALTPQVFRIGALQRAWAGARAGRVWTDEAALLEEAGMAVRVVEACHPNPKLTTGQDLALLRALVAGGEA